MDMIIQELPYVASDSQLCMHRCFAHLSAALEMGIYSVDEVKIGICMHVHFRCVCTKEHAFIEDYITHALSCMSASTNARLLGII